MLNYILICIGVTAVMTLATMASPLPGRETDIVVLALGMATIFTTLWSVLTDFRGTGWWFGPIFMGLMLGSVSGLYLHP